MTHPTLTVDTSDVLEEFATVVTFKAKNDYHNETYTIATFSMLSCENFVSQMSSPDFTMTTSTHSTDLTLDLSVESSKVITWEAFTYTSIPCPVDMYKVICKDPFDRAIEKDGEGNITGDTANSNCIGFDIETDPDIRTITIPSTVNGFFEGEYSFEIIGYSLF